MRVLRPKGGQLKLDPLNRDHSNHDHLNRDHMNRDHLKRTMSAVARSPITDPVCGDVLQDKDGGRRSVEIHERSEPDKVRYRCSGADLGTSAALCECDISDWQRWASEAEVLHAAHKPFAPVTRHRRRGLTKTRRRQSVQTP